MPEKECIGLVFAKTGSIKMGTVQSELFRGANGEGRTGTRTDGGIKDKREVRNSLYFSVYF
jgi:hypothetical protein